MAWILLKETPIIKREGKFDVLGAVLLFITLTCLLLAINRGQSLGWSSLLVISLAVFCVLALSLFLFVELRAKQPVLDLRLYRNRLFSMASGSHLIVYIATGGQNFLMPFYLIQGLGFSTIKAGLVLVTIPSLYVLLAPLAGRLSDKLGTRSLCTSGLVIMSIGLLLLGNLGTDVSTVNVVLPLLVIGIGSGIFASPNTSAIMGSVPKERLGTGSAMIGTLRQIGMSMGTAIAGTVFTAGQLSDAAYLTSEGLSETSVKSLSTIGGFRDAIFVASVFAAIASVVSALRGRRATPGLHPKN